MRIEYKLINYVVIASCNMFCRRQWLVFSIRVRICWKIFHFVGTFAKSNKKHETPGFRGQVIFLFIYRSETKELNG